LWEKVKVIIIGEKINGTLKNVSRAIEECDVRYIRHLAELQIKAGVDFLDLNAGGSVPDKEADVLAWLVEIVQNNFDTSICLDSASHETLIKVIPYLKKSGMINSVNGTLKSLDAVLPLVKDYGCDLIALLMDEKGIPSSVAERFEIASRIISRTRDANIPDGKIYFDALVQPLASSPHAGSIFFDTLKILGKEFPKVRTIIGVSNVSFGLPERQMVNRAFVAIAAAANVDAFIIDPLDKNLLSIAKAARAVVGLDLYGREYLRAYRQGLIR
jgi:cobalamin-dependent methionine synthase I